MMSEVKLKPGWLIRDTRRAADRVHEWTATSVVSSRRPDQQQQCQQPEHTPRPRESEDSGAR